MLDVGSSVRVSSGRLVHIERHLGTGGQGEAYLASVEGAAEPCVLKLVFPPIATTEYRERLRFLCSQNLHAKLKSLYAPVEYVDDGRVVGYVAPLASGVSLDQVLYDKPIELDTALLTAIELAQTVRLMRERAGIEAHGDLSASNILLDRDGDGILRVKLIDFDGFAHPSVPPPAALGTPQYMCAELMDTLRGISNVRPSHLTDRYALAVVLHEILLQVHPFITANTPAEYTQAVHRGVWPLDPALPSTGALPGRSALLLSPQVHELFRRAFGGTPAERPAPEQWVRVLYDGLLHRLHRCCKHGVLCMLPSQDRQACPACGRVFAGMSLRHSSGHIRLGPTWTRVGRLELGDSPYVSRYQADVMQRGGHVVLVRRGAADVGVRGSGERSWRSCKPGERVYLSGGDRIRFGGVVEVVVEGL